MNTTRNVSFGSGVGPSGYEVESAMFTPEVGRRSSGVMRKLDNLKSRTSIIKSNVQRSVINAKSNVRSGVSRRVSGGLTKVQSSMRTSPAKWAGIAAGSGFILGMLGRMIQTRNEQRRHMPQLVVIETSC
jgi:hypothetical protein